jgi:hypothetical protein
MVKTCRVHGVFKSASLSVPVPPDLPPSEFTKNLLLDGHPLADAFVRRVTPFECSTLLFGHHPVCRSRFPWRRHGQPVILFLSRIHVACKRPRYRRDLNRRERSAYTGLGAAMLCSALRLLVVDNKWSPDTTFLLLAADGGEPQWGRVEKLAPLTEDELLTRLHSDYPLAVPQWKDHSNTEGGWTLAEFYSAAESNARLIDYYRSLGFVLLQDGPSFHAPMAASLDTLLFTGRPK